MPHKHKRQKTDTEASFNLPPTSRASALPVKHAQPGNDDAAHRKRNKKSRSREDDTPRAFAQLMKLRNTGKGYKGLDNGPSEAKGTGNKKRKRGQESSETAKADDEADTVPKLQILPGEKLSDYAARVDQALPVSGLIAKGQKTDGVQDRRQTKHEKKLQRLVNNWKAEEKLRIERLEEEWDEAEEKAAEDSAMWEDKIREAGLDGNKKGKKGKRKGDEEEDWRAELKAKRAARPKVYDVVQAPPQFSKTPKEFKVKDGAKINAQNVPNQGSLRRQEILSENRQDVINRYREMMRAKRGE